MNPAQDKVITEAHRLFAIIQALGGIDTTRSIEALEDLPAEVDPDVLHLLFFSGDREYDGDKLLKAYSTWRDKSPTSLTQILRSSLDGVSHETLWARYMGDDCPNTH